jgi:hypothetical protein
MPWEAAVEDNRLASSFQHQQPYTDLKRHLLAVYNGRGIPRRYL